MSTTIDQRVVEMRFDNKQFESNVQTSLSTLEKLKRGLNLTGASKGLDSINNAAKNNNIGMLGSAAETVGLKFNAMYTMADQALRNIVSRAQYSAERLTKALTIEPIKTGLQEYETQINSVQTILANTESKGTTLGDVNAALDELNTYADKTIYNFTEMTRNIGTFTAAGVELDKSVTSIKGIANLAAVSGSTSQQASTAMYQLSQALAAGKVQLMDWNSVVNAGMGGQVFQDALKRTASQMGYNVDEMIKKYGSFRESLTKGEWLTADVLTETLTQLSGAYSEADLIAQGYTEAQAKEITQLAETAVNAATKVKTFTQLIDTMKESAQSGWTQTWELLIGDFEEAKTLWTGVSDKLGEIINNSAQRRNDLLSGALTNNWDKMIGKINEAGIETSTFEDTLKSVLTENGYAVDEMIKKHGSLEKAFTSGKVKTENLKETIDRLSGSFVDLSSIEGKLEKGNTGENIIKVQEALKSLGYDLGKSGIDGIFGNMTEDAVKTFQELNGLEVTGIIDEKTIDALEKATGAASNLKNEVSGFLPVITEIGGRELIIESFKNVWEALVKVITPIKDAFREVFPPTTSDQLKNALEAVHGFTEKLIASDKTVENIKRTFKGLFSVVSVFVNIIKNVGGGIVKIVSSLTGLGGGLTGITGAIGDWLTKMSSSVKEANWFGKAIDNIVTFITNAITKIKEFGTSLKESFSAPKAAGGIFGFFISLWNIVKNVSNSIIKAFGSIGETISEAFGKGDIFEVFNTGLISGIFLTITKFTKSLSDGFENAGGFLENLTGILDDVRGCFQAYQDQLKAGTLLKIAGAIAILAAAIFVISTINPDTLAQSLGAITVLFTELLASLAVFNKMSGTFKGTLKAVPLMIALSVAILILAAALKVISAVDTGGLIKGLTGIAVMVAILTKAAKIMDSEYTTITKFAGQMVIMSVAIAILAGTVKMLSNMNWNQMAVAGTGLLGITVLLVGAAKIMDGNDKAITKFAGQMLIMSSAIAIVGLVAKMLSSMNWNQMAVAGTGVAGIVTLLVVSAKIMGSNDKAITKFAGQMVIMSIAIAALAGVAKIFSSMSWGELAKGGAGLLGIVVLLAASAKIMDGKYASITKFAGQMLVMSLGITVMAGALKMLSGLSVKQILTGLLSLAGALTIIGVAGLLLQPVIPAILALGGALALFGLGVVGIGAGLVMIGAGLTSISVALAAGAVSIVGGLTSIILGLLNLVPEIAQIIGRTILEVAALIGDYAPQLAESFCKLIVSTIESLATYGPQMVNSLLDLIISLINGLADHVPTLITAFSNLLGKVFEGVVTALNNADTSNLLKGIAAVGLMAIVARMLSGILTVLPSAMVGLAAVGILIAELALVLAAVGQLTKIEGIEDGIAKAGDILNGIGKAIGSFIGGIGEGLTESLVEIGQNIADFMTKLSLASDNAKGVDGSAFDGVSRLIGVMGDIALTTVGTSISDVFTLGGTSMEKFQTDGVAFFNAMKAISQASTGISLDEASIGAVIGIATQLSDLQSSLDPIGGVIDWFTGRDDLGTFGENAGAFLSSMTTALGNLGTVSVSGESLTAIIDAATRLSDLQSSLEPIGGVISWFTGRDDLATFGENIGEFISSITSALSGLGESTFNAESLSSIIDAATRLSGLQSNLENIGGVVDWFTGRDDLATFGENISSFVGSMTTAFADLGDTVINSEAMTSLIDAATKLADLQSSLENMDGVIDWFTGKSDLGTFGTKIGEFATAMGALKTNMGEDGITESVVASITNAGNALVELNKTLPEKGWFDKKEDLTDFSTHISNFATAISDFSATCSGLNAEGINTAIVAARRIKNLIDNVADLDTSGVAAFTGIGIGGAGADGAVSDIADALVDFGKKVSGVDVGAISTASTAATRIKNLIAGLVDLDTSGIEKFKITSIATALKGYSTNISGVDVDVVSASITAANKIKSFITSLAGLDISGVSAFTSSISTLGKADISSFTSTFSSVDLSSVGSNIMSSLASGIKSKNSSLTSTATTMVNSMSKAITDKAKTFNTAGVNIITNLIKGFSSKAGLLKSTVGNAASSASGAILSSYSKFYANGRYLGEGLVLGINAKKQSVWDAAYALGKAAVEGEKAGQQSNSPSKATIQAGKWFGEGLVIGIDNMGTKVYKAGRAIGDTAVKSLSTAISRTSELVNSGIFDNQPTIRPVLDLSNVESGASSISRILGMGQSIGVMANVGAISSMMNNRNQNGSNDDVVSAINKLSKQLGNIGGNVYNVNGITYDDGSNISDAVQSIVRAARVERRI